jgi:hypothetical protein
MRAAARSRSLKVRLPASLGPASFELIAFPGRRSEGGGLVTSLKALPLFEIATVLVRLDHIARRIVNANHSIV